MITCIEIPFWAMEYNKEEDELSTLGMYIHLSQAIELPQPSQVLSHMLLTATRISRVVMNR